MILQMSSEEWPETVSLHKTSTGIRAHIPSVIQNVHTLKFIEILLSEKLRDQDF